jgi:hypothetical protein
MVVGKGKCRSAEFQLTPQETGTASAIFALESENYSKTIIEEIKVE